MVDELNDGLKKIQNMINESREKHITADFIIEQQGTEIKQLGVKCDAECQANQAAMAKLAEMEKSAAEKPKTKFKHHFMAPWADECPDCVMEDGNPVKNPHPVPKDALKTDEVCSNCKSPVLPGWKDCPDCHEEL